MTMEMEICEHQSDLPLCLSVSFSILAITLTSIINFKYHAEVKTDIVIGKLIFQLLS